MKILLFLLFTCSFLFSQTYEEYLRSQQEAFSSFKEERDREFSEYLNKEWKAYKESQGLRAYEEPKPVTLPKAKPYKPEAVKKRVLFSKPLPVKKTVKSYTKIVIPPAAERLKALYLDYFGVEVTVHYDVSMLIDMDNSVSKEKITRGWNKLAQSKYEVTIEEIASLSEKLRLNDWGKYLLIKQFARGIYNNENEENIFVWFALLKLGYDAHISYQRDKMILLLPVKGELFSTVYYRLDGKKYYAVDYYAKGQLGSVMTYDNTYTGAQRELDFSLEEVPLLAEKPSQKSLLFISKQKPQPIALQYNQNLLHFFQTYPQVAYENYFSAPESILLEKSIKASFEPLLLGKSQGEALDLILAFVQKAFKYRVDREQFNREKVMFPSETIFYPYSDCEDRAILFSYMVKILLGMEVIGLKYPNHMATAVGVQERLVGEYVSHKNRAYIIADPTYVNARVGLSMPKYRGNKSYKIISYARR